jgi:RNA polymerase sigma factor (sigma-70 family)
MNDELAAALEALHPDAFGWALHCCGGDVSQAEDIVQNAYLKLADGRAVFSGRSSVKTWWFGVIRFTAKEEARRSRHHEGLILRLWNGRVEPPSEPPGPSHQVELDEESTRLRAALSQLPARQAEVLHLVFYQDLSLSASAAVLGISIGSVRQHYERGKARLRELLTANPMSAHERL